MYSCQNLSSMVMRPIRSRTRASTGSDASRYGCATASAPKASRKAATRNVIEPPRRLGSFDASGVPDHLHCGLTHEDRRVESLSIGDRCHVAIVVARGVAVSGMEPLPDGGAYVGIRAVIQEQPGEGRDEWSALAIVHPEIGLRDDRIEQRGIAAE